MAQTNKISLKENLSIGCLQCLQLGFPLDLNRHPDAASKEEHVLRHLELDFGRQSRQLRERIWNKCFPPENHSANQTFESKSAEPKGKEQVLGYKCGKCNKNFSEKGALKQHLDEIHLIIPKTFSPQQPFSGQSQAESYSNCHLQGIHSILEMQKTKRKWRRNEEKRPKVELLIKDENIGGRRLWSCLECRKKCSLKSNLLSHILHVHLGEKPFQCEKCSRRFSRMGNLRVHLKNRHKVKL